VWRRLNDSEVSLHPQDKRIMQAQRCKGSPARGSGHSALPSGPSSRATGRLDAKSN
jgi:hypothetical protein